MNEKVTEKTFEKSTSNALEEGVRQYLHSSLEKVLRKVFQERRELWVESIADLLQSSTISQASSEGGAEQEEVGDWLQISSLSQLRKEVGGRFQNLRTRWLEAGFPLKAHRGDSTEEYQLEEAGWLEMTSWLLKQGYESRLLDEVEEGYFEIRKPQ